MKTNNTYLFFILLSFLIVFAASSCSSDDDNEDTGIFLSYPEENVIFNNESKSLSLTPFSEGTVLIVKGGDGIYKLENNNKGIITIEFEKNRLSIKPVSLGTSQITIEDNSGNSYILSVSVEYARLTYDVFVHHAVVEGDI